MRSDPMVFGLGAVGLIWLLAGVLALAVGLVLATRRVRAPITDEAEPSVLGAGGAGRGSSVKWR